MKRTTKFMLVAVLWATVLWPCQLLAMDVQQFANMATEDQKHYLAFLVSEAQELLVQRGERDEAQKVERLFRDIPQGSDRSVGESQFESFVASALDSVTNVPSPLKGTMRVPVESLLSYVLNKNGIKLTRNFPETLHRVTRNRVFYQKPH